MVRSGSSVLVYSDRTSSTRSALASRLLFHSSGFRSVLENTILGSSLIRSAYPTGWFRTMVESAS